MAKKPRNKFKFRQGKNLFIQLIIMLPLSLLQTIFGIMAIVGIIKFFKGDEHSDMLDLSQLAMFAIGAALAIGVAILMVKLKGYQATEEGWDSTFKYDFANVPLYVLKDVYRILARTYNVNSIPYGDELEQSIAYIQEITSYDWNECGQSDLNQILSLLSPYKISGGSYTSLTVETVIWAILSPLAFLFQWVAVCFAIMQIWSRRIYSCFGKLPFPVLCLKLSFLQEICHFLFNFVYLTDFKFLPWMGNFDERPQN